MGELIEAIRSRYGEPPTQPDGEDPEDPPQQPEEPPPAPSQYGTAPAFGNPVKGRIGPVGQPDPSSGFVVTRWYGDGSMPQYGIHDGLDIDNGGPAGDPICAMYAGTVYQAYTDPSGALIIRIDHGGGWTTGYAHMSKFRCSVGQTVSQGQQIGDLGMTGYATGPHVHMDTSYNNARKDPWPLLAQNQSSSASGEGDFWMRTYGGSEFSQQINDRYLANAGARFREDTNTDAHVMAELAANTVVLPMARVDGETVSGSDQWYLAWLYVESRWRIGALHSSTIRNDGPAEETAGSGLSDEDVDAAQKNAADAVRDAGVSALNSKAKEYGA